MFIFVLIAAFVLIIAYFDNRIRYLESEIKLLKGETPAVPARQTQAASLAPPAAEVPQEPIRPPSIPSFVPPVAEKKTKTTQPHEEFEFKFGSRIFTAIGAVAIMFGVGFFLRYAFANDLITETARVVIGLVSGVVLLGLGKFTRRRYAIYGEIVTGLGLGVLYLSLYSAFNFYDLMSQTVAFAGMIVVTTVGVWLSVRYDSLSLASFAAIGGFLTPVLLSTGTNNPHALFGYLILLNLGILAVTSWKRWRGLTFGSFIGTAILYLTWYFNYESATSTVVTEGYATLFFVIFLAIPLIQYVILGSPKDQDDIALLTLNPIFYFAISYMTLMPRWDDWMGLFTVGLALLYLSLAYILSRREQHPQTFSQIFMGVGFVLLILAVPIQFNKGWVTIGWAAEGLALTYLGYRLSSVKLRILALAVFAFSFLRLILIDIDLPTNAIPWLNVRAFAFLVTAPLFVLAGVIHWLRRGDRTAGEPDGFSIMLVGTYFLIVIGLSIEIYDFYDNYWLPILWSIGGLLAGFVSFALRNVTLRTFAYLTLLLVLIRLFTEEVNVVLASYTPLFNARVFSFLVAAISMGILASLVHRTSNEINEEERRTMPAILAVAANALLFWLLTKEIIDYFDQRALMPDRATSAARLRYANLKNMGLSVGWTLYAIVLLIAGIIRKSPTARLLSLALLAVVILKVFLYDTMSLSDFYRFVSFITLGVILLLAGYLYYRYQDRIVSFLKANQ